jgi:hypothetical protein
MGLAWLDTKNGFILGLAIDARNPVDFRQRRRLRGEFGHEIVEQLGDAFNLDSHPALLVADEPPQSQPRGQLMNERPEPNALNYAIDGDVAASHEDGSVC